MTLGHHVKVGYFAQHHADTLHPDSTPSQEVASMDPNAGVTRVRTVLGAFLFRGDDVDKKIRVLSGGERARVALARLLVNPGNFLMMDEPTNHLDLGSAESLAESFGFLRRHRALREPQPQLREAAWPRRSGTWKTARSRSIRARSTSSCSRCVHGRNSPSGRQSASAQ